MMHADTKSSPQAFMVWKYPTNKPGQEVQLSSSGVPSLTNDKFDKVMRGKCRSTYQVDYKGLPPGRELLPLQSNQPLPLR